ncbi:adenylyltransferase/cytidyltransferase family protein [Pseudothermotoga sp.]
MYVTTIGVFDGVHLGHKALLKEVNRLAQEKKLRSRAFVVSHPFEYLTGSFDGLITSHERRILLLSQYLDEVELLDLRCIKDMPAQEFFDRILAKDTAVLVVGRDFRFGRNALGDLSMLEKLCEDRNIILRTFPDVLDENQERISSSRIRNMIKDGKIEQAERLLGHEYLLEAVVLNVSRLNSKDVALLQTVKELVKPQCGVFQVEEQNLNIIGTLILEGETKLVSEDLRLAPGTYLYLRLMGGRS